jgi:hypothetical protein
MSFNPLTTVMKLLFGDHDDARNKRQLEENTEKDPNDRWIPGYDDKRRRIYYYNPKLQEIAWKLPTIGNSARNKLPELASSLLPEHSEWLVAYDRTNDRTYYYNAKTQESRWELPSSSSTTRLIQVEYQNKTGLVAVPQHTKTCFAKLREEIIKRLDADMHPPSHCEWRFQVSDATISKQQEVDTTLFQALLGQSRQLKVKIVSNHPRGADDDYDDDAVGDNQAEGPAHTRNNQVVQQTPPSSQTRLAAPGNSAVAAIGNRQQHLLDRATVTLPPRVPPQQMRTTPATVSRRAPASAAPPVRQTSPKTGPGSTPPPPPPPPKTKDP